MRFSTLKYTKRVEFPPEKIQSRDIPFFIYTFNNSTSKKKYTRWENKLKKLDACIFENSFATQNLRNLENARNN